MVHLGENPGMDGYITFNCLLLTKKKAFVFSTNFRHKATSQLLKRYSRSKEKKKKL